MKYVRVYVPLGSRESHPARGAWIEISDWMHGKNREESHPARGAWIEISGLSAGWTSPKSHPARGAWIEMFKAGDRVKISKSRTPQGVRGLKFQRLMQKILEQTSHPARGAWIEITN